MNTISLNNIEISNDFLESKPRDSKVAKAVKYIEKNGRIDKPVVLNNGILVDNYARYLAAKIVGLQEVPYVELQQMSYIVGKFRNSGKEYIWKNDRNINIKIGDDVFVRIKYKEKTKKTCVTVTNIFLSDDLSLYNKHKSVLNKLNKH